MTSHVKPLHRTLAAAFLLLAGVSPARADPDAQMILKDARMAQTGQHRILTGHLRVQSTGQIIPFTLVLDGDDIRYAFKDKTILLRLGQSGSQLFEAAAGDMHKVSPARFDQPVEGTDITYEDLALKFFYWPNARIQGTDIIGFDKCWTIQLEPGGQPSAYSTMELWIAQRANYFVQGKGFDKAGKLVKQFKVVSPQRDPEGGWMLKKMRISTFAPGQPESITYLEIDK